MEPRNFFIGRGLGIVVLIAIILVAYLLWGAGPKGDYAYRCADGTEFSITPSEDATSIMFYPSKSAQNIPETVLAKVETESGARYEAGTLVFFGQGESVQLISTSLSTVCTPTPHSSSAPYNWGD